MVDKLNISADETPAEAPNQPLLGEPKPDAAKPADGAAPKDDASATAERPAWLPEKFKTVEDFVASHAEGEKKITELSTQIKAQEGMSDEEISTTLQSKGMDLKSLKDEVDTKGGLSPESYKKLEEAGFPKDMVDSYIEGQQAIANNMANEVKAIAGGEESYGQMIAWAKTNLKPEEITAYDNAVSGGDINIAKMAAQALAGRYRESVGKAPNLKGGDSAPTVEAGYRDWSEVTADMKDPRYKNSEAFRAEVADKLSRSTLA